MTRTRHHPSDNRQVNERQADQKAYHDRKARERSLIVGQRVVVKNQIPAKTCLSRHWTDMLTMSGNC